MAIAQALCTLIILAVVSLDAISIPAAYTYLQKPCSPCDANSIQMTVAEAHSLQSAHFNVAAYAAYVLALIVVSEFVYIGIGVLILMKRADDGMALFTAVMLVTFGGAAFTGTLRALPVGHGILWTLVYALNAFGQCAFIVFLLIFPSGRFMPRWTILPAIVWSAPWTLQLLRNPTIDRYATMLISGPAFLIMLATMIVAQVYRYKRLSTPFEKQQTKWVVFGVAVGLTTFGVALIIANVILPASIANAPIGMLIGSTIVYSCLILLPVTIAIAILRSRLYDIDIIINRTLVYGSLTAILAGVYFGGVIGAQRLADQITGHTVGQQPIAVVLTTLLISALFQPLRHSIQRTIDRRFYRSRYNASETVASFNASLRSEVDLTSLNERLLEVVETTMRPTHSFLWLADETRRPKTAQRHSETGELPIDHLPDTSL
jgi:hypothetical protein